MSVPQVNIAGQTLINTQRIPAQLLAAGQETLVASLFCGGVGRIKFVGIVAGAALTDLRLATSAHRDGFSVTDLSGSGGDFANTSIFLIASTASPHQTAAGGQFKIELDLGGSAARLDVFATSAAAATLAIEVCGVPAR